MEVRAEEISRVPLEAEDGEFGICKDLLFDNKQWVVRYMVADTHKWIPFSDKVVISPISIDLDHWEPEHGIPVQLSKNAIKNSPPLDENLPISREYEIKLFRYYGYAYYWMGPGLWGTYTRPTPLIDGSEPGDVDVDSDRTTGLRSINEVKGYQLRGLDGIAGQVEDFVLGSYNWKIDRIVVSNHRLLPGGSNYLIPVSWVSGIDWMKKCVYVDKPVAELKQSVKTTQ